MAGRARDAAARGGAARTVGLTQQLLGMNGRLAQWLARSGLDAAALTAAGAVGMLAGDPQDIISTVLERRDRLGIDELVVPAEMARRLPARAPGAQREPVTGAHPGQDRRVAGLSVSGARAHTGRKAGAGRRRPNR